MNRRNFLRATGAVGIPTLLSQGLGASPLSLLASLIDPDSDKILVLIRLSGGNDGLNTLVGIDQLDNLTQVRPSVALGSSDVLDLNGVTGLHPGLTGLKDLFDNGKMGAVQAVGYPNQNRSHFRSTDIWSTASNANQVISSGWLGRYLNEDNPDYPVGYPNADNPDPLAITMGRVVSETCQGFVNNFSLTVEDPFNYTRITPGGDTELPPENVRFTQTITFVRNLIRQSNSYGDVVQAAANDGNTLATGYTDGSLSDQLRDIAQMISGGLQTKIYVATLTGFDTHSRQVNTGNNTTGRHADLMTELGDSVKAFVDDLDLLGVGHRVLGMTFSEFGRRIRQNASDGTDHGDASPLFVFGDCVAGGVFGSNPVIDPDVDQNTGVPYQNDFRDVYGSVLVDWFDVAEADVRNLLYGGFEYLPIFNGCAGDAGKSMELFTRSVDDSVEVTWNAPPDPERTGFVIERGVDGRTFRPVGRLAARWNTSTDAYTFEDRDVSVGPAYYYRIRQETKTRGNELSPVQLARLRGTAKGDWSVGQPTPNPVVDQSSLQVYAPVAASVRFEVIGVNGALLDQGQVHLNSGVDNRIALPVARLNAGAYVYRLHLPNGERVSRKLIKR